MSTYTEYNKDFDRRLNRLIYCHDVKLLHKYDDIDKKYAWQVRDAWFKAKYAYNNAVERFMVAERMCNELIAAAGTERFAELADAWKRYDEDGDETPFYYELIEPKEEEEAKDE